MILVRLIVTALTILGFIATLLFFISCFTDNQLSKLDKIIYTVFSGVLLTISICLIIIVIILWHKGI